jgi:hypothetical protein
MNMVKRFVERIRNKVLRLEPVVYYSTGKTLLNDPHFLEVQEKSIREKSKPGSRTEVINTLLSVQRSETCYLEIGVRDPEHNFNHIKADKKYSVDPGYEFKQNPVDFKLTSDEFFKQLSTDQVLSSSIRFDVIFIDGLHLAEQVDRDIQNALLYIKEDGFIVLHDCDPPSEWHARETYAYAGTPARAYWNGTTWKAFLKWRCEPSVKSCCIDTDWGVGILSRTRPIGDSLKGTNPFFEFAVFDSDRANQLNLIDLETLKRRLGIRVQ